MKLNRQNSPTLWHKAARTQTSKVRLTRTQTMKPKMKMPTSWETALLRPKETTRSLPTSCRRCAPTSTRYTILVLTKQPSNSAWLLTTRACVAC